MIRPGKRSRVYKLTHGEVATNQTDRGRDVGLVGVSLDRTEEVRLHMERIANCNLGLGNAAAHST